MGKRIKRRGRDVDLGKEVEEVAGLEGHSRPGGGRGLKEKEGGGTGLRDEEV
jgi:hypothetical protein